MMDGRTDRQTDEQILSSSGPWSHILNGQTSQRETQNQSVDRKSLSTLGLYKDQLRTQILKNKYQLRTKNDS